MPARTRDLAHAGLEPPSRPIRASPAARSACAISLAPGEHSGPRACSGGKLPWGSWQSQCLSDLGQYVYALGPRPVVQGSFVPTTHLHPSPNPQPSHPPRCNPHPPASRWLVWTHCTAGNRSVDLCYRNGDARVHANRAHRSMLMRGASQSPLRCSLPRAGVPTHRSQSRLRCGLPRAGVPWCRQMCVAVSTAPMATPARGRAIKY